VRGGGVLPDYLGVMHLGSKAHVCTEKGEGEQRGGDPVSFACCVEMLDLALSGQACTSSKT